MVARFSQTRLSGGTLEVTGPLTANPGMQVKHLRFMVAQGDVMVEDEADVGSGGGWSGKTPAGGLQPGAAHGFGLAVMFNPASPPGFETFTWLDHVTLTT
jgi:hypothetical protein